MASSFLDIYKLNKNKMANKNTKNQKNVVTRITECCGAAVERTVKILPYGDLTFKTYYYTCSKCKKVIKTREYIIQRKNTTPSGELNRYNLILK